MDDNGMISMAHGVSNSAQSVIDLLFGVGKMESIVISMMLTSLVHSTKVVFPNFHAN